MRFIPFQPGHVAQLANYGGQEHMIGAFDAASLAELAERGVGYTGLDDAGHPAGCGGLVECNPYRAMGWGLFARTTPQNFLAIHNQARRTILASSYKLIEAYVDPNFHAAIRWARRLGFALDRAYLPYWFPDGSGAMRWVLYRGG